MSCAAQVPVGWIDKKLDASDTLQNPWLCCDCVVGISHPLRPDVTAAVQSARQAGDSQAVAGNRVVDINLVLRLLVS